MSLRINSNVEAFGARRSLNATSAKLAQSMQRLSSGLRINSAADDASGLGQSEYLRGQISGLEAAQRNAQDAISLVQTAEGAAGEVHSILQRIRELAVQYQTGTNTPEQLFAITNEVAALSSEITRMSTDTTYNGVQLLNNAGSTNIQIGANQGDTLAVNTVDITVGISTFIDDFVQGTPDLDDLDDAIAAVAADRTTFGVMQNRLEYATNALAVKQENLMAAESRIRDVDMAEEMTNFSRAQILQQSGTAMLAQANSINANVLTLLR